MKNIYCRLLPGVILLLHLCPLYSGQLESRLSYTPLQWQKITSYMIGTPPVLNEGEEILLTEGAVWAAGKVIWVLHDKENRYGLLSWEMSSGKTQRLFPVKERIRSLAFDPQTGLVLVRFARSLVYYSPEDFTRVEEKNFAPENFHWSPMTVTPDYLVTMDKKNNLLLLYDKKSLTRIKEIILPREKTQNLIAAGDQKIYLWSSYWGSYLYLFDLEKEIIAEESLAYFSHRPFFKAVSMDKETIGLFDPLTSTYDILRKVHKGWIPLREAWMYGDGLGYRYQPVTHQLEASYTITASEDMAAQKIALVIPPAETYGQTITYEEFPAGNTLQVDVLGNRYLVYEIKALKKGETLSTLYYRARITRYKVLFNIPKILGQQTRFNVPGDLEIYVQDDEIYALHDPVVEETYRTYFAPIPNLAQKIQAIYDFAVHDIENVWDSRNDPTPLILKNRHGGCTEHSRVQISMLRKAGIPARFNWNWIPLSDYPLPVMNHKHAEAWLPGAGWVPLEPLGNKPYLAGSGSNYHLIWGVRATLGTPYTHRMDVLAHYLEGAAYATYKKAPILVSWNISPAASL